MGILTRIEEIRAVEHQKLRTAVMRVDLALRELEEAYVVERAPPPRRVDMFGTPLAHDETPPPPKRADLAPLRKGWPHLEEAILRRLDQWEEVLWPTVRAWVHGRVDTPKVQQVAADLLSARSDVDKHLNDVRKHAWFVEELTEPMHVLYAALDLCDRAEQDEVIPALLSGSRELADQTERSQTGDDIARNLRASLRASQPPQPRSNDPLARLLNWMGGRGAR